MYCSACGTQIAPGLSFCNRCGTSLKEHSRTASTATISAYLTAVTVLGVFGLGIMFGGALVLTKKAHLNADLVGIFMLFTFLLVGTIELMLLRQLSKLVGSREEQRVISPPVHQMHELRPANVAVSAEPLTSVTDNTTRTLEYARREQ
jgi:predicted nucleic acid-binding Zn ribbon protein